MENSLKFKAREDFHEWLIQNSEISEGVWLLFGKKGGQKTISASEALEEALSFGWIDGQMQKIDDFHYKKYFTQRTKNSKWSDRNKKIVEKLDSLGLMTEYGKKKVEEARENGQWDAQNSVAITDEDLSFVANLIKVDEQAYNNYLAMPPSVKKTYTRAYLDAKTEAGKKKRLAWMMDRLSKNLKPM